MFSSSKALFAKRYGYQIKNSLRFRSSASAYLSRTPASAGNRKTWTWSGWVKRGTLTSNDALFHVQGSSTGTTYFLLRFDNANGALYAGNAVTNFFITSQVFRDPSAWYHIVLVLDTTQAAASDRLKLYVNGSLVTSFSSDNRSAQIAQNSDQGINQAVAHFIGKEATNVFYIDGYLAEVNFIDGQALTPSSFGTNDPATGVWVAKQYTGTYGTNGFYLPFNPSAQSNGNDSYTTALLHFDNSLTTNSAVGGSTTWSSSGSTVAANSTNGIANFNNSATFTAANTDYITSTASSDYNFTGDFTIDFWYRPTSTSNQTIFRDVSTTDWNTCSTGDYACFIDGVRYLAFQIKGVGGPYDTAALTANTWYHVAVVRSGSTITLYKDGTSVSTFSYSGSIGNTKALEIGRAIANYTASGIDGRVDEFRVSKGIARWTSNFTRPSLPYGQAIGADASGAGNYWEAYNVNATSSGTTYDAMIDAPNIYASSATQGVGNYATLNPLKNAAALSNGNLTIQATTTPWFSSASTIGVSSGKWYFEGIPNSATYVCIGVATGSASTLEVYGSPTQTWTYDARAYTSGNGSSVSAYGASYGNGDVIGVALDLDAGTLTFYKNGTSQGTAFNTGLSNTTLFAWASVHTSGTNWQLNFGQRPFAYTPPSGFKALNTSNLPTPTIANGAQYMAATTYTGANPNAALTVTTTGSNSGNNPLVTTFQPDFVWIKSRVTAYDHALFDAVRGANSRLASNTANAAASSSTYMTSFNSGGFSLGVDYGQNAPSEPYIAWQWNAGGAPTVDNTAGAGNVPTAGSVKINGSNSTSALAGSIAATRLSANTSAGFSIVTYTGNSAANQTIGHGLGVTPALIIVKCRSQAATAWVVWNATQPSLTDSLLQLNTTIAYGSVAQYWGSSAPNSTVFGVKSGGYDNNQNGQTHVAYCFAPVAGYSAFGSLTSNGVAGDGVFVYLGFRPRWVLLKRTNTTGDWVLIDTTRNQYNVCDTLLYPNGSYADTTLTLLDALSNGFKIRAAVNALNNSGDTLIYAAFAENPFKYSNAR